jgi:hypothetical protein
MNQHPEIFVVQAIFALDQAIGCRQMPQVSGHIHHMRIANTPDEYGPENDTKK